MNGQNGNGGRPSKLTPELTAKVAELVEMGNYPEAAALAAGIGKTTYYRWMEKGAKESSGKFREFRESIEKAKARAEVRDVLRIEQAAKDGSWQAAMTRLERMYPERWGRRDRLTVNQTVDQKTEVKLELDDAGMESMLRGLRELGIIPSAQGEGQGKTNPDS